MIPEKWRIVEEKELENGRIMVGVLVGTNNREDVVEYMYKDVLEGIQNGTYEFNVFTKTVPAVCVFYQDRVIPHNAGIEKIKEDVKRGIGAVPVKLFVKSLQNRKPTGNEYAISRILDQKYNVELIRLCIRELFGEIEPC